MRRVTQLRNKLFRFIVHNIHAYVLLCNERNITICCKFPQVYPHQILLELVNIWLSHSENKKVNFFETQCMYIHCAVKQVANTLWNINTLHSEFAISHRPTAVTATDMLLSQQLPTVVTEAQHNNRFDWPSIRDRLISNLQESSFDKPTDIINDNNSLNVILLRRRRFASLFFVTEDIHTLSFYMNFSLWLMWMHFYR